GSVDPAETRPLEDVREGAIAAATSALAIAARHWLGTAPALAPRAAPRRCRASGMRWARERLAGRSDSAGPYRYSLRPLGAAVAGAGTRLVEIASGVPAEGPRAPGIAVRAHPGTARTVLRAVDSYRPRLTVVGEHTGGIAIRHVGGQDDVVPLRTGLHLRS